MKTLKVTAGAIVIALLPSVALVTAVSSAPGGVASASVLTDGGAAKVQWGHHGGGRWGSHWGGPGWRGGWGGPAWRGGWGGGWRPGWGWGPWPFVAAPYAYGPVPYYEPVPYYRGPCCEGPRPYGPPPPREPYPPEPPLK